MWDNFIAVFTSTDLVIPAVQMGIYVTIINILMLMGYYRACFLVSLSFAYYWFFVLNQDKLVSATGDLANGVYFYIGAALLFFTAAMFSLFVQRR